jgi:hypothetical protein
MSAGPFVAGLKCSGNILGGIQFICMAKRDFAMSCKSSDHSSYHNIIGCMQIAIIQTKAADFVKMYICVILKPFGRDCKLLC